MAKRRPLRTTNTPTPRPAGPVERRSPLGLRRLDGERGWALVLPPCAAERADDLDEVRAMIEEGEVEVATDELRYLLSGCPELIEAHVLLGQIAAEGDASRPANVELARGHFGFAFGLGEMALEARGVFSPIPGNEPANAAWHEAARGLAWCLEKRGDRATADRVAAVARRADPTDPAEVGAMLDTLRSGGLPIVGLGE